MQSNTPFLKLSLVSLLSFGMNNTWAMERTSNTVRKLPDAENEAVADDNGIPDLVDVENEGIRVKGGEPIKDSKHTKPTHTDFNAKNGARRHSVSEPRTKEAKRTHPSAKHFPKVAPDILVGAGLYYDNNKRMTDFLNDPKAFAEMEKFRSFFLPNDLVDAQAQHFTAAANLDRKRLGALNLSTWQQIQSGVINNYSANLGAGLGDVTAKMLVMGGGFAVQKLYEFKYPEIAERQKKIRDLVEHVELQTVLLEKTQKSAHSLQLQNVRFQEQKNLSKLLKEQFATVASKLSEEDKEEIEEDLLKKQLEGFLLIYKAYDTEIESSKKEQAQLVQSGRKILSFEEKMQQPGFIKTLRAPKKEKKLQENKEKSEEPKPTRHRPNRVPTPDIQNTGTPIATELIPGQATPSPTL